MPIRNKQISFLPEASLFLIIYKDFQTKKNCVFNKTNEPHLNDDSHPKENKKIRMITIYYNIGRANFKKTNKYSITH